MVIFLKLPSDTLVSLFQAKIRYYMIIFQKIIITHPGGTQWPNWSIWSTWLKVGIIWSFSQNYHQTPWYLCFNLKVGIIWSLSQNYQQTPWGHPVTQLTNLARLAKSRYYMVISPKLSSGKLVPLFKPINRYYMIIFPKLSSYTLGVPRDLKYPIYQ